MIAVLGEGTAILLALSQSEYSAFVVSFGAFCLASGGSAGVAAAIAFDVVPREHRGIGTSIYFLLTTTLGPGLGPFLVGFGQRQTGLGRIRSRLGLRLDAVRRGRIATIGCAAQPTVESSRRGRSKPMNPSIASRLSPLIRYAVAGWLLSSVAACSLLSIKSPEKPLSPRDLNARILTREYSARFIGSVEAAADEIDATRGDAGTHLNVLRWKIAAASKSQRAAGQMAPMMALLDSWALAVQMSNYFTDGAGKDVFGAQQPLAASLAAALAHDAQDLTQRLASSEEFAKYRSFIDDYVQAHPFANLQFERASVVELWARDNSGGGKLVDSLGTVPEALADTGDRLRMYGETAPKQILWQAQLAVQESGVSGTDLRTALARLDERMTRFSAIVDAAPKNLNVAVRDAGVRFDSSMSEMMRDVRTEGSTLSDMLNTQRQSALDALDVQRAALAADASRISTQVIGEVGEEVRHLVRQALILVIALIIVLLGAPFAAGYFVGRARRQP